MQVSFYFTPDIINKCNEFSKTLLKKGLEFVPRKKNDPVPLNLSLLLLIAEVDPIFKEQGRKKDALVAYDIVCLEIIFILLAKVVTLHL